MQHQFNRSFIVLDVLQCVKTNAELFRQGQCFTLARSRHVETRTVNLLTITGVFRKYGNMPAQENILKSYLVDYYDVQS